MAKNYMKYIANQFGLELGEKFKLLYSDGTEREEKFTITENGLKNTESGLYDCTDIYMDMLRGCYDIKKLPWKPAISQGYYIPRIEDGRADYSGYIWSDSHTCDKRYDNGLVCRTTDEAIEKAEKMLAVLKEE